MGKDWDVVGRKKEKKGENEVRNKAYILKFKLRDLEATSSIFVYLFFNLFYLLKCWALDRGLGGDEMTNILGLLSMNAAITTITELQFNF